MISKPDAKLIDTFIQDPKTIVKDINTVKDLLLRYTHSKIENDTVLFTCNDIEMTKLFIIFLEFILSVASDGIHANDPANEKEKAKIKSKIFAAIDYEFNQGKIALMQIAIDRYIWLINPNIYVNDKNIMNTINKLLFTNKKVYKVFHGSDSLDLPYVYNDVLYGDRDMIVKFTNKLVDTRFLCEYVRSSFDETGKCSIYDAMLYFKTIDQAKYDSLQQINKIMGPSQDVLWNLDSMSSYHIKYAYNDVLYLTQLFKDIYGKIHENPKYENTYKYIIQVIRLVILERKSVTDISVNSKQIVNTMNNYMIKFGHTTANTTMLAYYNITTAGLVLSDPGDNKATGDNTQTIDMDFIESINYIKGALSIMLKHIFYFVVSKKYDIYVNKTEKFNIKIDIDDLMDNIENINMYRIVKLFELYRNHIEKII